MTAIVMMRLTDGILAAADGLSYGDDAIVMGVGSKIVLMPEHSTVITLQGPASLISLVRNRLGLEIDGFDDVIEDLPEVLESLCDEIEDRTDSRPLCNAYVGGWSKQRERWETYYIRSIPPEKTWHYSLPGEPWTLQPGPLVIAAPWPTDERCLEFGIRPEDLTSLDFDAVQLAIRLIAASRHEPVSAEYGNTAGTYLVGGFIEAAFMFREACSSSIVHRWPDPAGERVDPTRGQALPAICEGRPIRVPPAVEQPKDPDA